MCRLMCILYQHNMNPIVILKCNYGQRSTTIDILNYSFRFDQRELLWWKFNNASTQQQKQQEIVS